MFRYKQNLMHLSMRIANSNIFRFYLITNKTFESSSKSFQKSFIFNIFISVQTIHFRGFCENQHLFCTLLTFLPDFFNIFMWICGTKKMLMCTRLFWGEGVSESV